MRGTFATTRVNIREGAFADDVIPIVKNEKELQGNIKVQNTAVIDMRMKINKNKNNGDWGKETKINIRINTETLEQVKHYQYLGTIIDENGTQDADINNRIAKKNKLYYAMNAKFINIK